MNQIETCNVAAADGPLRRTICQGRRAEPRLGGRSRTVRHDIGVRIPPSARALIDYLRTRYGLDESEVVRVLLVSAFHVGDPLRDLVALALAVNGTMATHRAASRLAVELEDDLAALSALVARSAVPRRSEHEEVERGPRDPTLLRVRVNDALHRRLRHLVEIYVAVRHDAEIPQPMDEAVRRLVHHLTSRSARLRRRERSGVAEVVRWALSVAEADADQVLELYMRCRVAMWSRIERAMRVMREGATEELRAALDSVR